MTISTFGVVYGDIQAHFFPSFTFGASSTPTSTAVTGMITAAAAKLAGRLMMQLITPSTLTDTASAYYAWCADAIRLDAAIHAARAMAGPGIDTKLWEDELDQKYKELQMFGYLALGDAPAPTPSTAGTGPRTHITEHDLDVGDLTEISDVAPVFRKNDQL